MENIYRDNAVFNMSYEEFMRLCFNAWKEDIKSFHFDRSKKEHDEKKFVMKKITSTIMNPSNTNLLQLWRWLSDLFKTFWESKLISEKKKI